MRYSSAAAQQWQQAADGSRASYAAATEAAVAAAFQSDTPVHQAPAGSTQTTPDKGVCPLLLAPRKGENGSRSVVTTSVSWGKDIAQ